MNGYIEKLKHKIALRIEPDKKQKHVPAMEMYLVIDDASAASIHIFITKDQYELFKAFYLEHTDYYRLPDSDVYSATVEQEDGRYWFTLWGKAGVPYRGGLTYRLLELRLLLKRANVLDEAQSAHFDQAIPGFVRAESKTYA